MGGRHYPTSAIAPLSPTPRTAPNVTPAGIGYFPARHLTTGSVPEIEYGVETEASDPTFVKWIGNVTAPVGKDVTLQCSVRNVGNYKVCKIQCSQF